MTTVTVIGIGSPFGADRLGWQAIEALKAHPRFNELPQQAMALHSCDRPGVQLLNLMSESRCAILIDAVRVDGRPDETDSPVLRLDKAQLLAQSERISTHDLGVAEALALGDALGQLPKEMVVLGLVLEPSQTANQGPIDLAPLVDAVIQELRQHFRIH